MTKLILGALTMSLSISQAIAAPVKYTSNFSIPQTYTSIRALGMGNAFTAVVDDHSAVLYNPAALARRTDGVVRGSIGGGVSDDIGSFMSDIGNASGEGSGPQELMDVLEKNYGKNFHLRFPIVSATWVRPRWGVAFIPMNTNLDMSVNRSAGGFALGLNLTTDSTFAYGYGNNVNWFKDWFDWDGLLSVGVTGKAIHRIFVGEVMSVAKLITNDGDLFNLEDAAEGLTIDADLGMLFTPNMPTTGALSWLNSTKPTFSFVLRNVLDQGFTTNLHVISETSLEPPKLQRRIDIGSLWELPDFWVFDPHLSVEMKDLLHENWSAKKGLHIGAELYWKLFNWWKGSWTVGLNQEYLSYGVGARFALFQLDLVSYGEEVGTTEHPVENRRYMLEMSLEF